MCPPIRHPNLMSLKGGSGGCTGVWMMVGKKGEGSFGARSPEEKLEGC